MLAKKTNKKNSYTEYTSLDLPAINQDVLHFWDENQVFKKSIEDRQGKKPFVFYEGPPSANGMPGIHHVMARTVKDIFCRYKTLQGYQVKRKGGWDTHGLPVELKVEKELGISKEDIGTRISVEAYNQYCRKTVMQYKEVWDELTKKMGYWVDLDNPYITFENDYIESVWAILKKLYDKDLLYKGHTIQPYSPAAGSGLSSHELNQPGTYRDVKDTTIVAQFKVVKNPLSQHVFENNESLYFLAWTTTPWTLPSNTALAVGKKITYVKIKTYNPYTHELIHVILAENLVNKWFSAEQKNASFEAYAPGDKHIPYLICKRFMGSDLAQIQYQQLLPYQQPSKGDAFKVILGDFVTTTDGTGIVHIAPAFGVDDMRVAKQNHIGVLCLVDERGKFVDQMGEFSGRYVKNYSSDEAYKSVDVDIAIKLKKENKAFKVQKYIHSYPHCWRTDKPVLYYPLDSWFVRSTAVKKELIQNNKQINWKPPSTGEGRFGNWLENLQDWNLSRSRFWGIPLPIWRSVDGKEEKCIGSVNVLNQEIQKANKVLGLNLKPLKDLHRPYIDRVVLVSDTGQKMYRETDVIDVWFDSGSMPYAQWHYPFENQSLFEENYPADFIAEGVDQTRGWFFTLHTISTMLYNRPAFKNVIANGLVLDKKGQKMSKRLGNAIDPFKTIDQYGADATRWYMISNAQPWDNLKFDLKGIDEVRKKFFGTLYQVYAFFALYANIDTFKYAEKRIDITQRPEIDRWVISKLHSLIKDVENFYDTYEPTKAARAIQHFVDRNLSNWYVRLCRRRFWKGTYSSDKIAAYQTLYECLDSIAKLIAPIAPFFAEFLFYNLNQATKKEKVLSVHLSQFPIWTDQEIDTDLETRMQIAQDISSLGLSLRKKEGIKVRQPLNKILIPVLDEKMKQHYQQVETLICSELNIKKIEYISDTTGLFTKRIKPDFKKLGKKFGKKMKSLTHILNTFSQEDIREIETQQSKQIEIEGTNYTISLDEVEIITDDMPGWLVASESDITVALDISITEALKKEGIAREFVNKVQTLRKEKGYAVTDKIRLQIESCSLIYDALLDFKSYVCNELLVEHLAFSKTLSVAESIDIHDVSVRVFIRQI